MEVRDKVKIVIVAASLAVVTILITAKYRRRRRRLRGKQTCRSSCYLHSERKPQLGFKRVLADNSYSAFKHLKLGGSSSTGVAENLSNCHPYEAEILTLLENPRLDFEFLRGDTSLEMKDSYIWVETESQLRELADALKKEKVFAVDTEQHSLRSFLGFTALIQISTQEEDYLVDTIALHDVMGILRPVFADPSICKVFHGADNDVLWLQRDFHIYVVNLFDTAKACDVLSKPQRSLAYLLETFCGVATNKLLQREDWRQRPLSEEMVQYARTDAHYLLYIAKSLTSELKKQSTDSSSPDDKFHFLLEASRRSNMICLQLYTKETEDFPGDAAASSLLFRHLNGYGDGSTISLDMEFQDLVRKLCAWRDLMARIHDESSRNVLSDQAILNLAYKLPSTTEDIYDTISQADLSTESLSFSFSVQTPSHVVCSHSNDVYQMIKDKSARLETTLPAILQKCLGTEGTCQLSVFNYSLLVNFNMKLTNRSATKQNGIKNPKQVARKASRELFVKKFSCKAPVYHNCRIYANDERLLCYCDRRKLEWYLSRGLAKLIEKNPPAIMLLFEPKGRPEDEDNDFYIQSKKNICVGCGEGNHYLRYRIIPSCYRIHFPEHLKSHRSHDIVLLCVDCHEIAHAAAEKYKKQVASEFGIPLFVRKVFDSNEDSESSSTFEDAGVSPLQLRTAAMALMRHGNRMPSSRREELLQTVRRYYGGREISEEDLERALLVGMSPHERRKLQKKKGVSFKHSSSHTDIEESGNITSSGREQGVDDGEAPSGPEKDMNAETGGVSHDSSENGTSAGNGTREVNDSLLNQQNSKLSLLGHGPHGKQVVEHLLREYGEDGVQEFCQRWRKVFVDAVKPRHLPAGWDVRHSGKRDFGEFSVYNPAKRTTASEQGGGHGSVYE
ncbi:PREDICTED: protein RRP6-like 3 isoform X2 [Tarenaya hassleriana]|uniref:protein RRP6-like 3 isoform X2 n=1 Tax=Tarenaya hassleriana TaxID=28532 RepID=UPI00053C8B17|nr:PREDICTED: protein RRP6-like 3 isoform X2 [Tarenaya hassleriana]